MRSRDIVLMIKLIPEVGGEGKPLLEAGAPRFEHQRLWIRSSFWMLATTILIVPQGGA
jgi:hypothetical protein